MKHTPGPWISHKAPIVGGKYGFVIQHKQHRGISIATLFPGISTDRIEEIAEANARLIAEAPAMLEALRRVMSGIEEVGSVSTGARKEITAILARIDGDAA